MQRVYGKKILLIYANQIYFLWFTISCIACGLALMIIYSNSFLHNIITVHFGGITLVALFFYIASDIIYQATSSFLNSVRRISAYGIHAISYQFLLMLILFNYEDFDLNKLILTIASCNLISLFFLFPTSRTSKQLSLRRGRQKIIFKYILKYSRQTIFATFIKATFDFLARSLLLPVGNGLALARVNFSLTIFHIFRILEQVVFKAVTPIFLKTGGFTKESYHSFRTIIIFKSLIVILIFCFSFIWKEVFFIIFPEKAINVFFEPLLILLAFLMVFSYWKNVYLIFCKTSISLLKNAFIYSAVSYLLGIMYLMIFGLNEITYGLIVSLIALINLLLIRFHKGGVISSKYFLEINN